MVVELRYDTIVRGELLGADDQLNLQLGEATYQPLQVRLRGVGRNAAQHVWAAQHKQARLAGLLCRHCCAGWAASDC